jgi:hypothetical protein
MKNIFKSILAFVAGAMAFTACSDFDDTLLSDQQVKVSKDAVAFAAVPAAPQTVTVDVDGDWIAILPAECDWLKVEPSYGTGRTEVKITALENRDGVGEIGGPRKSQVNFTTSDGPVAVAVSQMGDITKLSSKTYTKVDKVTPGRAYLLVVKNGSEYYAGTPVPTASSYAYLSKKDVTANMDANGNIVMPDGSYGFTFEQKAEGQYILRQADGEALWQNASYNNFYTDVTPSEGYIWSVEPQSDGTVIIKSVDLGKWLQYSISYASFGGYTAAQDGALLPFLYENADQELGVDKKTINLTDGDAEEEFTLTVPVALADAKPEADWITLVNTATDGNSTTFTFKSSKNPDLADRSTNILLGSTDATVKVAVNQPSRALTADDKGTLEIPMTPEEAIEAANAGQTNSVYVKGIVSKLVSGGMSASYGNGSFWISSDGVYNDDLSKDFEVYQACWLGGEKWTAENAQIAEGAEVMIYGPLTVYKGTAETQGKGAAHVYSVNAVQSDAEGIGTLADPFTAPGACVAATNGVSVKVYVEGTVSKLVSGGMSASYGNGSFWLSSDGVYNNDKSKDFEAYQVYWLGGEKWTAENPQIAVGDKVVLYGPLTTYKETCETQGKGAAYIYSLNGSTGATTEPETPKADLVITSSGLPGAYPTTITTVALSGTDFDIENVADYGNGIQLKGKVSSYIKTHADFSKKIKSIKLVGFSGKTWYPTNVELKAGDTVITPATDDTSNTYDLSAGDYKGFTITNTSDYGVYIGSIEINFAE